MRKQREHKKIVNLTTREEYLRWRAAWRVEYAALSAEVRELKRVLSAPHCSSSWSLMSDRVRVSRRANEMMLDMDEARELARAASKKLKQLRAA